MEKRRVERDVLITVQAQLKAAHSLLISRRTILTYDERQLMERVGAAIAKADLVVNQLEMEV